MPSARLTKNGLSRRCRIGFPSARSGAIHSSFLQLAGVAHGNNPESCRQLGRQKAAAAPCAAQPTREIVRAAVGEAAIL